MIATNRRWQQRAIALVVSAIFIGACGTSTKTGTAAGGRDEPAGSVAFVMPAVNVLDVATGAKVPFGQLSPSEKPLLLWFWAPH